MIEAYRRLASGLPERKASAAVAFARDARSLRAWTAALPMANFDAAAQQLLDGLRRLNRQPMTAFARLEALEVLAQPIADVTTSLERRILGASFPLPPHQAALADLSVQFQSELATGYRTALVDMCTPSGAIGFMRGKRAVLAGVRALQCGHALLARCYLQYRTPPTGAWRDLHDLHLFLAAVRLNQRGIDDVAGGEVDARTAYVHALLFALANPYRYTQREQVDVCAFLRVLAPLGELRTSSGGDGVVVATGVDRSPGYLPEERLAGARDTLWLRLHRIDQYVQDRLEQLPPGTQSATFRSPGGTALPVDVQLVRRVLGYVHARGTRGRPRVGGGYALESVIGLHDLHVVLAGGSDFETFLRDSGGQIHLAASARGLRWRLGEGGGATRLRASVVDQSVGGYRLLWERGAGGEVPRMRVGDLVGLALPGADETDEPLDWMVGVVRWMRVDDLGQADAGIELLARRAAPVGVSAIDAGDMQMPVRGLLLEPLDPAAGPARATLLTSTELDRAAREMEVARPDDPLGLPPDACGDRIGDLQLIEATGVYRHFEFAPLAATAPNGA